MRNEKVLGLRTRRTHTAVKIAKSKYTRKLTVEPLTHKNFKNALEDLAFISEDSIF